MFPLNQSFPQELPVGSFLGTPRGNYYNIESFLYNPSATTSLSIGEFVIYLNSVNGKGIVDKGTAKTNKFIGFVAYTPKGDNNIINRDLNPGGLIHIARGGDKVKLLSGGIIPVKSALSYNPTTKKVDVWASGETLIGYAIEGCNSADVGIAVELVDLKLN